LSAGRAVEGFVFASLPVLAYARSEALVLAADALGLVRTWDRADLGVFVGIAERGREHELRKSAMRMLLKGGAELLH
jgi:hypothetical protein